MDASSRIETESRLLVLSGSPSEIGRQYAKAAGHLAARGIESYVGQCEKFIGTPYAFVRAQAESLTRWIPAPFLEELDVFSSETGIPLADLVALNSLTDLDMLASQKMHHCCNFVVQGPDTRKTLYHGRNLDYPHGGVLQDFALAILRIPSDANRVPTIALTWAGSVGLLTGCNTLGLSVGEVGVTATNNRPQGRPMPCILRDALERADSCSAFYDVIRSSQRMCAYNIAVADGVNKMALAIETTSEHCARRWWHFGAMVVDNICLGGNSRAERIIDSAGVFRHGRMTQLLCENKGNIDVEMCIKMLGDRFDPAYGRETGRGYNCICNDHTIQSALFITGEQRLLYSICSTPAPKGPYFELRYKEVIDRHLSK